MDKPQQNHFSITVNNPTTTKATPPNMVALKKIQNFSYALNDQIGLGFTSHVYKGKNELNNEQVAVKVIDLRNNEDELHNHFMNEEVIVLEKIKNAKPENLLKLQCVIKTKNNMYIITEFCEGKDLGKILRKRKRLPETEAHSIMKQLLRGYKELYSLGLIHRDLKLANIFITKGKVKIADFGFTISEEKSHEKMEYNVGSPYYMPPQALKYNRYSYKSDVWGMGVIAFQLIFGRVPWRDKNDSVLFQLMTTTPIQSLFDQDVKITEEYKKFIIDCLTIDFNKRASPQYIIDYEWPLASDFVDGIIEEHQRHSSIGHVGNLRGINKTQVYFQDANTSKEKEKTFQILPRNRSPSLRKDTAKDKSSNSALAFRQSHPIPFQHKEEKTEEDQYQEPNFMNSEKAILGQIHFCRFMLSLYKKIGPLNTIPPLMEVRRQLAVKINSKMQVLGEIVRIEKNLLKSPGFLKYIRKPQWEDLKQVIVKYDIRFREEIQPDDIKTNAKPNDEAVKESMKLMKTSLPDNWRVLELLTFYYQLKELQGKENFHTFYERSKIEMLAGDSKRGVEEFEMAENAERLRKKLDFMLI